MLIYTHRHTYSHFQFPYTFRQRSRWAKFNWEQDILKFNYVAFVQCTLAYGMCSYVWDHLVAISIEFNSFWFYSKVFFFVFFIVGGWNCSIRSIWMAVEWYITFGIASPRQKWIVHRFAGICRSGNACYHHRIHGMLRSTQRIAMHVGHGMCVTHLTAPLKICWTIHKIPWIFIISFFRFSSSAFCWLYWSLKLQPVFMHTSIKINWWILCVPMLNTPFKKNTDQEMTKPHKLSMHSKNM